jgi:hypothetical protein
MRTSLRAVVRGVACAWVRHGCNGREQRCQRAQRRRWVQHRLRTAAATTAAACHPHPRPPVERAALGEELGLSRVGLGLPDGRGRRRVRLGRAVQRRALGHGRARDAAHRHSGRLLTVQQRHAQGGAVEHGVHHRGHRLALAHAGDKVDGDEAWGLGWVGVRAGACGRAGQWLRAGRGAPAAGGRQEARGGGSLSEEAAGRTALAMAAASCVKAAASPSASGAALCCCAAGCRLAGRRRRAPCSRCPRPARWPAPPPS